MNKRNNGKWVKWLILIVVVAILAVLAFPTVSQMLNRNNANNIQANAPSTMGDLGSQSFGNTTTAKRGSLTVSVSGSGEVVPKDSAKVYSETLGRVETVDIEVGDSVKAGDMLIRLASDDLQTDIASLQRTLFDAQIALADVRDSGSSYNIYAPSTGRIKMMQAEEEDDVAMLMKQYGYLCVISRDGKMKVEFEPASMQGLNVGDKVNVWVKSSAVEGTIDQMTGLSGSIAVTIDDDSYDVGEPVTVSTLLGEKLGEGELEVNMPIPVTGIGGTVDTIYYEDNDKIGSGYRLFYLTGRTPSSALQQALLAYEAARLDLDTAQKKQEGLLLRAPMDGVITSLDTSVGATLNEGDVAFSMQSNDAFKVVASVDELDVVGVQVGQRVSVELDAYPNRTFDAVVERISGVGTVEGGVATYEVTVLLQGNDGFMDGMTANIEVRTVEKNDVILLPVEAISTSNGQNYVTIAGSGQSMVETGVTDGTNIEIISGVNEGDQVTLTRSGNSGSVGSYQGSSGRANSGMSGMMPGSGMMISGGMGR